jgi:hypothetical protein
MPESRAETETHIGQALHKLYDRENNIVLMTCKFQVPTTKTARSIKRLYFLFISRDNAIHPKGICGLGKTNEMKPVAGPRPGYHNKVNPSPSAVRCAQVSGYEPP